MSYSDESYESILGLAPTIAAGERTPEQRHVSLQRFFAMMEDLSDEELADNPLADRPLNVSILDEDRLADASAA